MDRDVPLRAKLVDELLNRAWSNNLVSLALNDDPRRRARREKAEIVHVRGRRDRNEAADFRSAHQELHADPGAETDTCNPGRLRLGMDRLDPVERARRIRELAYAVVEYSLALAHTAEIEAQRGKTALDERLIEKLDNLVVHCPAGLRVRMEDQRDRGAGTGAGMETSFEASLGTWENDFGHVSSVCSQKGGATRVRSGVGSYIGAAVHVAIGRNPRLLSASERLYLDHAAITPVVAEAREAVAQTFCLPGNPSSPHADGRKARAVLESARRTISEALDWRHDVVFTSGATEAIGIAVDRVRTSRRILGPTEHEAVVAAMGPDAAIVSVDANGLIDLPSLEQALAAGPAIVAIQLTNNETGVIQPLDRIHYLVRSAGSLLLADCAQATGKIALPNADFIAITSQKFGGPVGAGALLVKNLDTLEACGGQERGYRRGTENLPGISGMAAALASRAFKHAMPLLKDLREQLEVELAAAGGIVIASDAPRISTIGAYAMPGTTSSSQLAQFDLAGISVSAGSACSSGTMKASRVLAAMKIDPEIAKTVIRVSYGPNTCESDVDRFLSEWRRIKNRTKAEAA
jgi:cysteine desulfurase